MSSGSVFAILFLIYLTLICALSYAKKTYFSGRVMNLFRSLFPSWRFFEELAEVPVLFYRTGATESSLGEWQEALPQGKRFWGNLFLNPRGNLVFACGTLLDQLMNDIEAWDTQKELKFNESVSYRLVKNMVLVWMKKNPYVDGLGVYQFKVSCVRQGASQDGLEDVLISPVYESET